MGKTYFLAAIANELAQLGFETTLVHVPTLSSELKSAIGANRLEEKVEFLKTSPILMLDDIGAESNSAWFRDEILMIVLEYRMMQELPTFFSSNLTIEELQEHLSVSNRGDVELLKAKRLIERVRFLSKEIFFCTIMHFVTEFHWENLSGCRSRNHGVCWNDFSRGIYCSRLSYI